MTAQEFRVWRTRLRLTQARAAAELGITPMMVKLYERGSSYSRQDADGEPATIEIPRAIELACAALEFGPLSIVNSVAPEPVKVPEDTLVGLTAAFRSLLKESDPEALVSPPHRPFGTIIDGDFDLECVMRRFIENHLFPVLGSQPKLRR
jgi:hypothetical protein